MKIYLFKRQIHDNKLYILSKIYDSFCLQSFLSFGLSKSSTNSQKLELVLMSYLLNVAATSDQTFHVSNVSVCSVIFCRKYTNRRITLFDKLDTISETQY